MNIEDVDYALPDELIAQHPPAQRRDARLLAVGAGERADNAALGIADLPHLLRPGDLMVVNDTRVIPARLFGRKESGGALEILIERVQSSNRALAHIRASKSPKAGTRCLIEPGGEVWVRGREDDLFVIETAPGESIASLLERCGHVPLPPYIERNDTHQDAERYQTVFARQAGAVAAPTAGLHLDQALLDTIAAAGVTIKSLTLHVGAGTFRPVRGGDIDNHVMHAERFSVSEELCTAINAARNEGRRVVAIGTTVTRALESAARQGLPLQAIDDDTRLFIRPGFQFQVVDALMTNFHLPRSTLLMLVCAFAGYERVMAAYRQAVAQQFRFFSYGDAMWLQRAELPSV